jgi:hypothetical protein
MILFDINSWWEGLSSLQMIYWIIAVAASLVFVIQLILTLIGSDAGGDGMDAIGDADLSVDSDSGIGFQFISIKNFFAFFTIFGWVGLACIYGGLALWAVLLISICSGLLMMLIMASIYFLLGRLAESGTLNINSAKGKTASVYLFIPPKRSGKGKIQINLQGYQTMDAMTDDEEQIPTGSFVEVVDVINGEILLVKKSK